VGASRASEQPLHKEMMVNLFSSFPLQVGAYRARLPGLSTCGLLVFSRVDERLYDS